MSRIDPLGLVGEPNGWPKEYPDLPLSDDKLRSFRNDPDTLQDMLKRLRKDNNFSEADKVKKCQKEFDTRNRGKQRGQPNMRSIGPLWWISVPLTCFLYPEACDGDSNN